MNKVRAIAVLIVCAGLLAGCGGEPKQEPAARPASSQPKAVSVQKVSIQPSQPTVADCLQAVVPGQLRGQGLRWEVNGQQVGSGNPEELCPPAFKRGDQVTLRVGPADAGSSATVAIGNNPPKVTGISATPKQLYGGLDVEVAPVAEDPDGDAVEFRYQWLINGEEDPLLTEAKLPGNRFGKGDKIQVRIIPNDGESDGPAYLSFVMPISDTPPKIVSRPPQAFTAFEYRYQVKAQDPDGDKLTFKLEKAPQGMTVDPATGLVVWPLTGVRPGIYPVRIAATDPSGAVAYQEYNLSLGASAPAAPSRP